jgi:O-antigen/teichoic acid export membrane protein
MSGLRGIINRYGLVSAGPVAAAIVQFLLSLVLLRHVSPAEFGTFAFLLLLTQLLQGVWGALFCAPLVVAYGQQGGHDVEAQAISKVGGIASLIVVLALTAIALVMGITTILAVLYGTYGALSLIRLLARGQLFATGKAVRAAFSDLVYALAVAVGIAVMALGNSVTINAAFVTLIIAVVFGMFVFDWATLRAQFDWRDWRTVGQYKPVWRKYAAWSLMGVITTEVTANSHAYLVGSLFGPKAFAPIAATALFVRPIGVGMNAIMEYERAQMARSFGAEDRDAVQTARWHMLAILSALWIVTALFAAAVLSFAPRLLFPATYTINILALGATLWLGVAAVRVLRAGDSAMLQAAGAFQPLALASLYACGFSILGVAAMLAIAPPLWSILGTILGEAGFALWTRRAAHRLTVTR